MVFETRAKCPTLGSINGHNKCRERHVSSTLQYGLINTVNLARAIISLRWRSKLSLLSNWARKIFIAVYSQPKNEVRVFNWSIFIRLFSLYSLVSYLVFYFQNELLTIFYPIQCFTFIRCSVLVSMSNKWVAVNLQHFDYIDMVQKVHSLCHNIKLTFFHNILVIIYFLSLV